MEYLKKVGDEIWLADGGIVSFLGFPYPTRCVVIRLQNGGLWIWSPIKLTPELRLDIDRCGPVEHLVSPNKLHHLFLAEWRLAYPKAMLWGPSSTIKRHSDWDFGSPLQYESPAQWQGAFDQAWFRGSVTMDEIAFYHRPSRTAIIADLIQAFDDQFLCDHWQWWQRPLARLGGISAARPQAPFDWRLSFIDRSSARLAREKVLGWNCDKVILAHGIWQRDAGSSFLVGALAWLG
jgi:hypothetical protein